MRETAVPHNSRGARRYKPAHSLDDLLELREDKETFTSFVTTFLKPVCSTKWKGKRCDQKTKKLADIITVSDEAFVLLTLENNWERWIDINNKANDNYAASTCGKSNVLDLNVMTKCTYINKKRTDDANRLPTIWRGWNNQGILRFNDLCKAVKEDRKQN